MNNDWQIFIKKKKKKNGNNSKKQNKKKLYGVKIRNYVKFYRCD